MLLIPGAERERRALLLGASLTLGAGLAWWPVANLERALARALDPALNPVAAAAGWVAGWVAGAAQGAPESPPLHSLEGVERAAARPPAAAGLAWFEVPVLRVEAGGTELVLAAGRAHGLAPGQVVAYGLAYIGRLAEVGERTALVVRPQVADERTGVTLPDAGATRREAILLGRGARRPPVLNWIADGGEPEPGQSVLFRGRSTDPPGLAEAGLLLGTARLTGDASRGERAWILEENWPPAAEGRVSIAMGALPAGPIAAPAPAAVAVALRLSADAVLGPRVSAWRAPPDFAATVLLRGPRVHGPVIAARGRTLWVRADCPEDWRSAAVVMSGERLVAAAEWPAGQMGAWFTRGGEGVPRGLWLGNSGAVPPRSGLAVLVRGAAPDAAGP